MNVFNKIIIVLILIAIVCVSVVGIFNSFVKVFKWSDLAFKVLNPDKSLINNPYISALILLLVIVFCIFLFILEFYRKKSKTAVIAAVREGTAMITLESAANQIRESISKISGVADIVVKVLPKSNGIILNIYAKICSDCNVPEKMQEIIKGATNFAVKKLGIKVFKTNLTIVNLSNIQYEPVSANVQKSENQKVAPAVFEKEKNNLSDSGNNYFQSTDDINRNSDNNTDDSNNNININT
ncbi:MAG: hypothetical protein NTV16_08290 [Actinobacteria bacterium]|jgi:NADH:ubiquinone oxidoreductase subunit 5 (subunit L)/multisubunit Na+/H+ antiporter MnhA subunit|nr:hypothetical protein [Actinomycetota bacterium]